MAGTHRICKKCKINHYENCDTCAGFGVYPNGMFVAAVEAIDDKLLFDVFPCEECASTEAGLPSNKINLKDE